MPQNMRHSATAEGVTGVGDAGPFCKNMTRILIDGVSKGKALLVCEIYTYGVCRKEK